MVFRSLILQMKELDAFYERCQKEVWPKLTELYGQEAVDMVQNLTK